jgi:hypothetical protein
MTQPPSPHWFSQWQTPAKNEINWLHEIWGGISDRLQRRHCVLLLHFPQAFTTFLQIRADDPMAPSLLIFQAVESLFNILGDIFDIISPISASPKEKRIDCAK